MKKNINGWSSLKFTLLLTFRNFGQRLENNFRNIWALGSQLYTDLSIWIVHMVLIQLHLVKETVAGDGFLQLHHALKKF
jgi:hypothetical protein